MQSDFFQSSDGDTVENLGLSAKYFVAESGIISAYLTCQYCGVFSLLQKEMMFGTFLLLEANLNSIAFFIWGVFLSSTSVGI